MKQTTLFILGLLMLFSTHPSADAAELTAAAAVDPSSQPVEVLQSHRRPLWLEAGGRGFRPGTRTLTASGGPAYGVRTLGTEGRHDFALISVSYGQIIGGVIASDGWYRGNLELLGEVFGGAQFNAETCWLIGAAPHVRYHLATGAAWVPYVDAAAGVTLTEIRAPDLSGSFQFNLQGTLGVNYFILDESAINLEGRFIHLSNAGMRTPNRGVNAIGVFIGFSRFF